MSTIYAIVVRKEKDRKNWAEKCFEVMVENFPNSVKDLQIQEA